MSARRETLQDVSNAFLEHAPRPKLRKATEAKPGAKKAPDSVLWILEDVTRGLALVRGKNVRQVLEAAAALPAARWSVSAKGYVIPATAIADVCAMAQYGCVPYTVKAVGE